MATETSTSILTTRIDATSSRFEANMRFMADLVSSVRNEEERIREGGGAKAIESQHKKGRKTARERIQMLVDPGSFYELGIYAAFRMYEEWGGAPGAGVITGLARVETRLVMVIVNDATVKAGSFFPMTAKKVIRAQNIAIENHIPTIYLVDSAGVFLPLQEDVFPDTDDFGRVFRNNAVMSAMGIPQIAAIMGMCVAGGGYLPVMCDHVLMTDGSGLFLAGPALVQAAIGQKTSAEELGGAAMHSAISGTVDFHEPTEESCLARIRSIIEKWGYRRQSPWDRKKPVPPALPAEEIYGIYDSSPSRPYDVKEVIARITDASKFDEYKSEYGKTLVCGYGRIGGFAVGIVANQKLHAQATDQPRKLHDSSWIAIRTWCRWFFCTTSMDSWSDATRSGAASSRRAQKW
jgi:acetyl-CoA carboxylase carboxyltransferase component